MKFHHFCTPWKNFYGYLWKNPLIPLGKNPSDAHALEQGKSFADITYSFDGIRYKRR